MNTKRLRDSAPSHWSEVIEKILEGFDGKGVTKNCLNCSHFDADTDMCKKYGQRPPARIIINSCEGYNDVDEIPF